MTHAILATGFLGGGESLVLILLFLCVGLLVLGAIALAAVVSSVQMLLAERQWSRRAVVVRTTLSILAGLLTVAVGLFYGNVLLIVPGLLIVLLAAAGGGRGLARCPRHSLA